jgi:TonB family protein
LLTILLTLSVALGLTLPVLETTVPAVYPQAALEEGVSGDVLLELQLDTEGNVVLAAVVTSAGGDYAEAFDEAAVEAARNFLFAPALDDAQEPVGATIQYMYRFEPEQAAVRSVEGYVRAAGTREALGAVSVLLRGNGRRLEVETNSSGEFSAAGLESGTWTVRAARPGYDPEFAEIEIETGIVATVELALVLSRPWEAREADVEIEVVGRKTMPEISERVLTAEEIQYLPGTNGDVVRVVQNLPGVARPPLNIGQLLIRGTAPEDSAYYLDGSSIPNVFHFAGLSTVVNGSLIDTVGFLPGNYGVRYGRTIGGVIDLRTGVDIAERSNGYVSVDLFQTTAFVEQRLSDSSSVSGSVRRSYIDAVLNPVLNATGQANVRAPRYYDAQLRWLTKTPTGGTFDVLWLSSDDRFRVVGKDADDVDQVQIGLTTWFHKLRLQSRETLSNGWRNEMSVTGGPENQSFELAPNGEAFERPFRVSLRNELSRPVGSDRFGGRAGVDLMLGQWRNVYDVPGFGEREETTVPMILPAAYVESTLRTGPVQWTAGVRGDYASYGDVYDGYAVDPRANVRIGESATLVKGSFGLYSQFPLVREAAEQPSLLPKRSWQASAGWEQRWAPWFDTELTLYSNQLRQLIVGREDAFRFFTGPPPIGPLDSGDYANEGTGRIFGAEVLARVTSDRTLGWIAGTFGKSYRTDRVGDEEALFEYDQPVILTALATHELAKRWRIGARFRYGSGNVYTPVVNRLYDLESRSYVPVYGDRDSERLAPFYSLDLRFDKDWVYDKWTLTFYLDLQNATSRQNVEVMSWNYDYSVEEPLTSIPVVPAFGLKGAW